MRVGSEVSKPRQKAEADDGVAAEQAVDTVGIVDGVDGELKEGQHKNPAPPAVDEVDSEGAAKVEGDEVPGVDDKGAGRDLNGQLDLVAEVAGVVDDTHHIENSR